MEAAFNTSGYRLEVLNTDDKAAVDMGLKYVNNDACFPSLIVVGQIMDAVHSGKYNLDKTAVLISQTGADAGQATTLVSSAVPWKKQVIQTFRLFPST